MVVVDQACLKYLHNTVLPIKNAFQCLFMASPIVISLKTTVLDRLTDQLLLPTTKHQQLYCDKDTTGNTRHRVLSFSFMNISVYYCIEQRSHI